MIALRPRDQHVSDPRPLPHEIETETKTNYCKTETETETKKVVSRPRWSRDLNIPECQTRKIGSDISPSPPLIFTVGKCEIWHCYQTTNAFILFIHYNQFLYDVLLFLDDHSSVLPTFGTCYCQERLQ